MSVLPANSLIDPANTHYALPEGLEVAFESSLPEDLRRLQGVWCGTWGGHIPQVLVIDGIQADGAGRVHYAWGDSIHGTKGSKERHLDLGEGLIVIDFPNGTVQIDMVPSGHLFGFYKEGGEVRNCVSLSKVADVDGADPIAVEHLRVPFDAGEAMHDSANSLYCTVYRDVRRSEAPLLLINHGSAAGGTGPAVTWLYDAQARHFVKLGFAVVVAMRRGRGKSDGPFAESALDASDEFCEMEVSAGVEDIQAVLQYVRAKDWASRGPCILAGQSRGGFLSLICAAQYPDEVAAVVNFSGGWWDEKSRAKAFQIRKLREAGARLRAPTVWLYGEEDSFYGPAHIQKLQNAFREAGGAADLRFFPSIGHDLIEYVHLWQAAVDKVIKPL